MAGTYSPGSHTKPETAKVGTVSINGLAPGQVYTTLNDSLAPTTVWLPTSTSSDGFPTGMLPFTTGTGTVT